VLCSNCYKKIPEGKEVAKTTGFWKVNGWGRWGNEIFCKKCAKKQDKKDWAFLIVFLAIWAIGIAFSIMFISLKWLKKI